MANPDTNPTPNTTPPPATVTTTQTAKCKGPAATIVATLSEPTAASSISPAIAAELELKYPGRALKFARRHAKLEAKLRDNPDATPKQLVTWLEWITPRDPKERQLFRQWRRDLLDARMKEMIASR